MTNSKSLYENILIGNFLYGLGVSMGVRAPEQRVPGCVSLLQQTPLDPLLGDALIEFPGAVRLFEFKRANVAPMMEFDKASFLRIAMEAEPDLFQISKQIHWFVQAVDSNACGEQSVEAQAYIELATGTKGSKISLGLLIDKLVEEVTSPNTAIPPHLLARYLSFVAQFHTGTASGGGLLVHIDKSGRLRYAPLDDVRDLSLQQSKYIEKNRERGQDLAREQQRGIWRSEHSDRSHDMDM